MTAAAATFPRKPMRGPASFMNSSPSAHASAAPRPTATAAFRVSPPAPPRKLPMTMIATPTTRIAHARIDPRPGRSPAIANANATLKIGFTRANCADASARPPNRYAPK